MSENDSSFQHSQTVGHAHGNVRTKPEAKAPVQRSSTTFVASDTLDVLGVPTDASTPSPALGDTASKVSNHHETSRIRAETHHV